ncbi:MAG: TolC family protein, partial [Desulfobacteraceae bacterium]|nr:TolC family protein [Desulfobacteraceae bacterium]
MRHKIGTVLLGGLCMLGFLGCAAGPDFVRPKAKVPSEWQGLSPEAEGKTAITSDPAELAQWWSGFNDPLLTSLVERAIRSNLDLRQAESRIRQARAALGVSSAGLWPTVDVNAEYSRTRTSGNLGTGKSGSTATTSNFFRTGLDAAWELDIFGGARRTIEASAADLEAAVHDRRD